MKLNNVELNVLIKGKSITEYPHNGQVFVEGRHKSNFEIEICNRNAFSVEAIVSVDGLSVIDGKEAGPASSGYMLRAHETLRIPGWKLNDEAVAAFEFSGKGNSYAAQSTGSARNTGVIGLMVYREKARTYAGLHFPNSPGISYGTLGVAPMPTSGGYVDNSYTGWSSTPNFSLGGARGIVCSAAAAASWGEAPGGAALKGLRTLNATIGANAVSATQFVGVASPLSEPAGAIAATPVVQQNLGTAFGEETDFRTQSVTFDRGDLLAILVLYYDDRQGLAQRGIEIGRKKARRQELPQAFPQAQVGCTPPKGWRG